MADDGDLTTIKQLTSSGAKDLKIDQATCDAYVKAVGGFHGWLQDSFNRVNALPGYGDPGPLRSSIDTKNNLNGDIADLLKALNDYMTYLDAFSDTVKAACKRMISSG